MTKEEVKQLQSAMNRFTGKFLENFPPLVVDGDRGPATNRRISVCKLFLGYKGGAVRSHRVTTRVPGWCACRSRTSSATRSAGVFSKLLAAERAAS